jgi:hypothetical protein
VADPEEIARKKLQRNALQINPTGAMVNTTYLTRNSEYVAVNRNDLNDLMQFDGVELGLLSCGQFFMAGGGWLFVEKYLSDEFKWDALTGFCLSAIIFGIIFAIAGFKMRSIKRNKITRIFSETTEIKA